MSVLCPSEVPRPYILNVHVASTVAHLPHNFAMVDSLSVWLLVNIKNSLRRVHLTRPLALP